MKKNIHPTYYKDATITCACGKVLHVGSTVEKSTTDICSNCHPFFTGKANIVDTTGNVEKFKTKASKAVKDYSKTKKEVKTKKKEAKKAKGVKVEE